MCQVVNYYVTRFFQKKIPTLEYSLFLRELPKVKDPLIFRSEQDLLL